MYVCVSLSSFCSSVSPSLFQTYASQVKAMDVNFRKMETHAAELRKDPGVGWADSIGEELRVIRNQWEPLKDNVNDRQVYNTVLLWGHIVLCTIPVQ